MSWVQTNIESHSVPKKAFAISLVLIKSFLLRIASGLIKAFLFLAATVLSLSALAYLGWITEQYWEIASTPLVIVVILVLFTAWTVFGVKMQDRQARKDMQAWLSERSVRSRFSIYYKWKKRAEKLSLIVPTLAAFCVIVFFPLVCGIASHIFWPRSGQLYQYRISIPVRWSILYSSENRPGFSTVSIVTAKEHISWNQWTMLLSGAGFRLEDSTRRAVYRPPDGRAVISTKEFSSGGLVITCTQYGTPEVFWPGSGDTLIECLSDDGSFRAWFGGQRGDMADFYEMISKLRKAQ